MSGPSATRNPWAWIPSLYFAQGIPYVVVMTVSVIMYKRMGISNTDIALYTSWLYLPWVIKPLWSPLVDLFRTKRLWIVTMQLLIGAIAGIRGPDDPAAGFFQYTIAFLWLMAFSSATHDIAADGFYMLGLEQHQQAAFVGVRSTFYRIAMIAGQGVLVIVAGYSRPAGWGSALCLVGHVLDPGGALPPVLCLPLLRPARPAADQPRSSRAGPDSARRVLPRLRPVLQEKAHRCHPRLSAALPVCRGPAREAGLSPSCSIPACRAGSG